MSYKICVFSIGTPNDIGTINKVTIIPDPPRSGKDIKVEADVTLSKIYIRKLREDPKFSM